MGELYKRIEKNSEEAAQHLLRSDLLEKVQWKIEKHKDALGQNSCTAKYWIQYLRYIDILKLFIWAERTGNWEVHLIALSRILNIFSATEHINYVKSARLHLQNMLEIETNYSWVYTNFVEHGYHTVRRSDKYWAGLWSDITIEKVLESIKKSRMTNNRVRFYLKRQTIMGAKHATLCRYLQWYVQFNWFTT